MRALAVTLVVVYHLAPGRLSGGFIGVDVFFVISGFLITLHLVQRPPSTGRDLLAFWGRRVRRLLPASLLVLAVTLVVSRLVSPETQWGETARQVRAAALYIENWLLAGDAVDYLAAEKAPSPVQHFWSLSVEEQFYFVWPVLVAVLALAARRQRWNRDIVVLAGLTTLVLASFVYSVAETRSNPQAAYFVTPARMWELGVGGVLAVAVAARRSRGALRALTPRQRALLAWAGLAAVTWSALTYSGETPFPGWQASVPILGTTAVIAANAPTTSWASPGSWLALRPAQWVGDISYSVYLWHWPLVVLAPLYLGHPMDTGDKMIGIVLVLALSWITKVQVEDRFRRPHGGRPLRKPFLLGALAMGVVVTLTIVQDQELERRAAAADTALSRAIEEGGPCLGARALDHPERCEEVAFEEVVPAPAEAFEDRAVAYPEVSGGKDCWSYVPHFPQVRCSFGTKGSDVRVALMGNSHAGQWLPALEVLADRHGWQIDTYLASRCASAPIQQQFDTEAQARACVQWSDHAVQQLEEDRPDVVVVSNRISLAARGESFSSSDHAFQRGYERLLERLAEADLKVLVLHDTPAPGFGIPDCIAENRDDFSQCDGRREDWLRPDPAGPAVRNTGDPDVRFVDLNDHICQGRVCRAVTGGVITYFDSSHLTATFARTLAPYLDEPLLALVKG